MDIQSFPLTVQIAAFTQLCKLLGAPGKLLPLISVFWGIALCLAESGLTLQNAIFGALQGLVTTGIINLVDTRLEKMA